MAGRGGDRSALAKSRNSPSGKRSGPREPRMTLLSIIDYQTGTTCKAAAFQRIAG
jgi:hypothetical protein